MTAGGDSPRSENQLVRHQGRVHENRHEQVPRAVVNPHHEHPVGRQSGDELHDE